MPGRRTDAEIREVSRIHDATASVANGIECEVNPTDDAPNYVNVNAVSIWHCKAPYQRELADQIEASFTSRDPKLIRAVANAMREAITAYRTAEDAARWRERTADLRDIHEATPAPTVPPGTTAFIWRDSEKEPTKS